MELTERAKHDTPGERDAVRGGRGRGGRRVMLEISRMLAAAAARAASRKKRPKKPLRRAREREEDEEVCGLYTRSKKNGDDCTHTHVYRLTSFF